ncbi:hypothetical protein CLV24_11448 [Pontibacter ummariensis]|uniref:Uncharacterized protein n=1 Tax=Pontibacter ummariensis TaxID=1610492 RepID=A0A239HMU3_9BACT|nr:hypothetical protein [Pontibacter ummariensis]PRY10320.1 hypothetical protein CLV24_11448 [Pontibacter ummariensis]SNS82163.1 hypothetical protein SAMN06296052_11448 [Pontibacter ummariensis]
MGTMLELMFETIDIKTLDKRQTVEGLFYIHQLLKKASHPLKIDQYKTIESALQLRASVLREERARTSLA